MSILSFFGTVALGIATLFALCILTHGYNVLMHATHDFIMTKWRTTQ